MESSIHGVTEVTMQEVIYDGFTILKVVVRSRDGRMDEFHLFDETGTPLKVRRAAPKHEPTLSTPSRIDWGAPADGEPAIGEDA